MKKLFFLLLTAIVFVGCEGPIGPVGPAGLGTNKVIEYVTVQPQDWERVTNPENPNEVFYRYVKNFDYTQNLYDMYDEGSTLAYLYHDYDEEGLNPNESQTLLPYVFNLNDQDNFPYTETWYYDYTVRSITFYVAYSGNIQYRPDFSVFRIIRTW